MFILSIFDLFDDGTTRIYGNGNDAEILKVTVGGIKLIKVFSDNLPLFLLFDDIYWYSLLFKTNSFIILSLKNNLYGICIEHWFNISLFIYLIIILSFSLLSNFE